MKANKIETKYGILTFFDFDINKMREVGEKQRAKIKNIEIPKKKAQPNTIKALAEIKQIADSMKISQNSARKIWIDNQPLVEDEKDETYINSINHILNIAILQEFIWMVENGVFGKDEESTNVLIKCNTDYETRISVYFDIIDTLFYSPSSVERQIRKLGRVYNGVDLIEYWETHGRKEETYEKEQPFLTTSLAVWVDCGKIARDFMALSPIEQALEMALIVTNNWVKFLSNKEEETKRNLKNIKQE